MFLIFSPIFIELGNSIIMINVSYSILYLK